jgi:prophage regulatory protein
MEVTSTAARRRRLVIFEQLKPEFGIHYCRVHLDRLIKANLFPRKIQVSASRIAWFEDEILQWLEDRPVARGTHDAGELAKATPKCVHRAA